MKAPDEGGNMSSDSPLAIPLSPLSSPNPGNERVSKPSPRERAILSDARVRLGVVIEVFVVEV